MVSSSTTGPDDGSGNDRPPVGDARRAADAATLNEAKAGDREAIAALWRQHAPHIVRLFETQRVANSEEVATRVWTDVARSVKRFVGDGHAFRRWLLLVASGHARAERPESSDDDVTEVVRGEHDDDTVPGAIGAMAALAPATAEAMMLRHVHGLSISDIAEITDSNPGAVRLLVHDGTKRLRAVLSVTDADGKVVQRGTEWTITDRLRNVDTTAEFVGEDRNVELMLASMAAGGSGAGAGGDQPQRRRRAAALVAASALLLSGGFVLTSLATDNAPASGLASVDDTTGPSGEADVRRLPETPNLRPGVDDDGATIVDDAIDPSLIEVTKATPPELVLDGRPINVTDDDSDTDSGSGTDAGADDSDTDGNGGSSGNDDRRDNDDRSGRNDDRTPTPPSPTAATVPTPGPPAPGPVLPTTSRPPTTGPVNIPAPTAPPTTSRPTTTTPRSTTPTNTTPVTTRVPSTTRPPTTSPPTTRPPVTSPPTTRPPVTSPPTTRPPITAPPTTRPPITAPPTTRPPITAPPTTRPPITSPPTTRPPVTSPPTTDAPSPTPTSPPAPRPPAQSDDDDDD